jgi:hypothetical protein
MSSIYEKLEQDHEMASELLEQLTQTTETDVEKRELLFHRLKNEVTLHSKAEDKTFYVALAEHEEIRDLVLEGREEHEVVTELLTELDQMSKDNPGWTTKLTELKGNIDHHVAEEESEMFSKASELLSEEEAEALGRSFEQEKASIQLA